MADFFLGTVREGRILTSTDGESWEVFAGPETHQELMAVMDIAIDQERGHLWVATAALTQFRQFRTADKGRTALLKLDLDSGELLSSHRAYSRSQSTCIRRVSNQPLWDCLCGRYRRRR